MVRSILAVILGWVIAIIVVMVFFFGGMAAFAPELMKMAPEDMTGPIESIPLLLSMLAGNIVGGIFGGFFCGLIAKQAPLKHAAILGVLFELGFIVDGIATWGKAPIWYFLLSAMLLLPCVVLGGWIRARQVGSKD